MLPYFVIKQGFTLLELLVTILILGILASMGIFSLLGIIQRQQLQDDAFSAASAFRKAVAQVRQKNTTATLTVNGKTLTTTQAGVAISSVNLNNTPVVSCSGGSCPAGYVFTISAPFGRNLKDFSLTFTRGNASRTLLVRGPLGWVNVQ